MAALDARNGNFISLLIDVSGRVRPGDLPGLSEQEAVALLEEYRAAHPEQALSFADGVLSVAAVATAPAAAAPVAAPPPAPAMPAADASIVAPTAAPTEELPSWYFGDEADAQDIGVAEATPSPGPATDLPGQTGADGPEFADIAPVVPVDTATMGDAEGEPVETAGFSMPAPRVSALWWLAVLFFGFVGALVAWFANRKKNPAGAKPFLIVGIVLLVLAVAGVVAVFALGGVALLGLG